MIRALMFAAAVAAALLVPAVASAAPAAGHARVCSTYDISWHGSTNPGWTKIHWTCNGHNPKWWIRAVSHCQDGRNNIVYVGRAVQNVGVVSEASCTSAYPVLAGSGYDASQVSSTGPWVRNWVHGTPVPPSRPS